MKKQHLFVGLAALAAVTEASALTRSFDGTGEAVLLPYFHAADGEATLFAVTNHSDQPKAVRVVIVEGRNGRAALSFNLYLSSHDSWNGTIAPGDDGEPPRLISSEESCTVPQIPASGVTLRNAAFAGSRADGLGNDSERLQQGSIEMIELGVPTGMAAQLIDTRQRGALVERFAEGGAWQFRPNAEIDVPGGGLTGEAQIIDFLEGAAYGTEAVVLDDFSFAPRHGNPGPGFNLVRFYNPTASPTVGGFIVGNARIPIDRAADAVSLTLMSTAFEAGFALPDGVLDLRFLLGMASDARTRMILTMPTRAAYLDNLPNGELAADTVATAPFNGASTAVPYCMNSEWRVIDGNGNADGGSGNPRAVALLPLCEQVNVITLGERLIDTGDFLTGSGKGRVRIDLQQPPHTLEYGIFDGEQFENRRAHGLPVVLQALTQLRSFRSDPRSTSLITYGIQQRILREQEYEGGF